MLLQGAPGGMGGMGGRDRGCGWDTGCCQGFWVGKALNLTGCFQK